MPCAPTSNLRVPTSNFPMRPYRPLKKRPRLSLCMIVKNEAATLDKCLSLARPHVDEIVVIDTGSTDGTQEIARRYADVYEEIEWPGSFSQARNYSLDKATGDFILILDGDEWIEDEDSWKLIRKAIEQPDGFLVMLPVRNVLGNGLLESDRFFQERIYRNHPLIRYAGRVHNQIADALQSYQAQHGGRIYNVEAEITHVGYAYETTRKKEKYAPRVALIEQELAEAMDPAMLAYYTFQLAVYRTILEEPEQVLGLTDGLDYSMLTPQNAYYAHQITVEAAFRVGRPGLAAAHGDAMLALSRTEPMGYYLTGTALLMLGKLLEGVLMLAEAGRVNQEHGGQARFRLNMSFVMNRLAEIFEQTGFQQQALLFQKVAESPERAAELGPALLEMLQRELILSEEA